MCGIGGAMGPKAGGIDIDAMMSAMSHRGPDGEGVWREDNVVIGHRRLAIVDLSEKGKQPFVSEDGMVVVAVNGEIYNYEELRRDLEAAGENFRSDCDSEVVLHAYTVWGVDAFAKLNGMFAFIVWDRALNASFLVRDRLGIKPLYYYEEGETLFFTSDVRALLAAKRATEWEIDPSGLASYLTYQNRFEEQTLFANVYMLAPGSYIRHVDGRSEKRTYWQIVFPDNHSVEPGDVVTKFRTTLDGAVKRHLMSDVPVAAYLSAGFDSSYVTSTAAKHLQGAIDTFTGVFSQGGWYDETAGARLTAKKLGVKHHEVSIDAETFRESLDEMVLALEEPRMGIGALPQFIVARAAAKTHKIILTGHGGDELFSGYPVFKFALLQKYIKRAPHKVFSILRGMRVSELPYFVYFTLNTLLFRSARPYFPLLFSKSHLKAAMTGPGYSAVERNLKQNTKKIKSYTPYENLFSAYLRDYLPGLLVVEDKISMAHSLEARTPFLDNQMVNLSLNIAEEKKLENGELKHVVKSAARRILPDQLYAMPKRGFPTPLASWLRSDLSEWSYERIAGENSSLRLLFKPEYLERTATRYRHSWRRLVRPLDEIQTHRMWMLLCLESWLRQFKSELGVQLTLPAEYENGRP